jgi:1-acyl-sn-glycerol-3-phosphate acyltransferase
MIREIRFFTMLGARTVRTVALLLVAKLRGETWHPEGSYDRLPREWATDLLDDAGITAKVTGLEHLEGVGTCVYCCNHTSLVDTLAVAARLPGSIRFVAKRELLRVPFFGWGLRMSGQIPIDRKDHGAAVDAFADAGRALAEGKSAVVFVEGTRSRDGTLQPFKKGAFVMAIATQRPCVPVYVSGAFQLLKRGGAVPRPGTVEVRIGEAIPTAGMTYEDRDRLRHQCWTAMAGLAGPGSRV